MTQLATGGGAARAECVRGMTAEEVVALPAMVSLDTASRALSLGRTTGQRLARTGEYPVTVHRLGSQYRVARADLLRLLGIEVPALEAERSATA